MDRNDIIPRRHYLKSLRLIPGIPKQLNNAILYYIILSMREHHLQAIICRILFTQELMIGKLLLMNKRLSKHVQ